MDSSLTVKEKLRFFLQRSIDEALENIILQESFFYFFFKDQKSLLYLLLLLE